MTSSVEGGLVKWVGRWWWRWRAAAEEEERERKKKKRERKERKEREAMERKRRVDLEMGKGNGGFLGSIVGNGNGIIYNGECGERERLMVVLIMAKNGEMESRGDENKSHGWLWRRLKW